MCVLQAREVLHASSLADQEQLYQSVHDMLLDQGRDTDSALPVLEVCYFTSLNLKALFLERLSVAACGLQWASAYVA